MGEVVSLGSSDERINRLYEELSEVIHSDTCQGMPIATIVGTLQILATNVQLTQMGLLEE